MNTSKIKKVLLLMGLMAFTACAHARLEKGLEEKLSREPDIKNSTDLHAEAKQILSTAQGFTDRQRSDIKILWANTRGQMDKMSQLSLKLRTLLVQDLEAQEPEQREIDLIKKRLSNVEHDRLSLYFASVRQTNKILGRWGSSEERYRFFEEMDFADHLR